MIATGSSHWDGSFHQGSGSLSTASGTLRAAPYTFASRFEGAPGTGPEELLAAAHAGCYNHALANILHKHELPAGALDTRVSVDMGGDRVSPGLVGVHIAVEARLPGLDEERFQEFAARAARTCALSRALTVPITCTAVLSA